MKAIKYFKYIVLSLLIGAGLASCNDDDLGTTPRLFRPVATIESQNNNIVVTWDNIKGASSYEIILFKMTGENEDGTLIGTKYDEATTSTSPYTFEGVEWDEKYGVKIKAIGSELQSEYYETKAISVVYPTKLVSIRTIDIAALPTWSSGGNQITALEITPTEIEGEPIIVSITDEEYASGQKVIYGLKPNTAYTLTAYSGEELIRANYEGKLNFTTRESENFDEKYGEGMYIDLRGYDDPNILISEEVKAKVDETEGLTVVLQGGYQYKTSSDTPLKFKKSVNFITGLSLEGNAIIVQSGAMQSESGANIAKLSFTDIDFISDKANELPIAEWTDKGFGGRQVYNVNGSKSMVGELTFKNCRIEGYRAIARLQGEDGINRVLFNSCTINGIGDQAVVTTNNKAAATMDEIDFINCTITNIVQLCDLRSSKNSPTLTVSDCTFCYAPVDRTDKADWALFRMGSNTVSLIVENTVFGPSMQATAADGSVITPYVAGKGSIFLNGTDGTAGVKNSYRTNFEWTKVGDKALTYPLDGLITIATDEKGLFTAPTAEEENYMFNFTFDGISSSGALKWRK